jgi:hypothetical protein
MSPSRYFGCDFAFVGDKNVYKVFLDFGLLAEQQCERNVGYPEPGWDTNASTEQTKFLVQARAALYVLWRGEQVTLQELWAFCECWPPACVSSVDARHECHTALVLSQA